MFSQELSFSSLKNHQRCLALRIWLFEFFNCESWTMVGGGGLVAIPMDTGIILGMVRSLYSILSFWAFSCFLTAWTVSAILSWMVHSGERVSIQGGVLITFVFFLLWVLNWGMVVSWLFCFVWWFLLKQGFKLCWASHIHQSGLCNILG